MNVFSLLANAAERFSEKCAVARGADPVASFVELERQARRLGSCCPAGERVIVLSANCPDYVGILFGIWAAGAAGVPVNAKLHPAEVAAIVQDCRPALGFVSETLAAGVREAAGSVRWIVIGSAEYQALLRAEPVGVAAVAPDDLAWLFYTSGTTGRSKGAMLSHRNLIAAQVAHLADIESVEAGHNLIHAAPMSHGSGLYMLPYLARGAAQIVPASGQFDPEEVLDLCDALTGCGMFLAPTMVRRMRVAAEENGRQPAGLRSIVYGGGPMHLEEIRRAIGCFGQIFSQIYGQGEAPMTITALTRRDHEEADDRRLASVGWARSGVTVRVAGPDGAELPRGAIGEILVSGDVVMPGYWENPAATAAALRDGWLWTGDMGVMDADGLVTLRDRSKDVIISGGSNVYPREVEEVLLRHPNVAEASVVGVPDDEWGEVAVAYVVADGEAPTADELDALCLSRIARFKRPKLYRFVSSLPKNAYGKVLKRELVAGFDGG